MLLEYKGGTPPRPRIDSALPHIRKENLESIINRLAAAQSPSSQTVAIAEPRQVRSLRPEMSRLQGKGRAVAGGRGFVSPAGRSPFGSGFSASGGSNLSYLAEPSDLALLSDANVVVSFKNLLKKDSMTKTKGLEDLVSYVQAHPHEADGGVEDAILEAWVQLYPRVAIDNSRRVRELSHSLQLDLLNSARKRMEKRLPKVVGPWLAGTFDKDRGVSRCANDGLKSFLNTEEKFLQLWKKCQKQILEYATEAIQETPDTLSDERSTNSDDAEAKYYRVIGGSLSLVQTLLDKLGVTETENLQDEYEKFLSIHTVWANATAKDPYVRKATFQLLMTCLDKQAGVLESQIAVLSKSLVFEGLKTNQTGSAQDLVTVLVRLTKSYPHIWNSKKEPIFRMRTFVEKGSQGGTGSFWKQLDQLFACLPQKVVAPEVAADLMKAMRAGISGREEPRSNAIDAWTCYLSTSRRLLDMISPEEALVSFVEANVYPLTEQYLHPSAERSVWTTGSHLSILPHASLFLGKSSHNDLRSSLATKWSSLAEDFVSRMSNSLPEVSKDYEKSQEAIADEGFRWFSLVEAIEKTQKHTGPDSTSDESPFYSPSVKVVQGASQLLKKRNYKPFGAACAMEAALTHTPKLFVAEGISTISSFFSGEEDDLDRLVLSPSAPHLFACINAMAQIPGHTNIYQSTWKAAIGALLSKDDDVKKHIGIIKLVSNTAVAPLAHDNPTLQAYLQNECLNCARGNSKEWDLMKLTLSFDTLTTDHAKTLVASILGSLEDSRYDSNALLAALEIIAQKRPDLISGDETLHLGLITKLLAMTEVSDSRISTRAAAIREVLDNQSDGEPPLVDIIQQELETASPTSLEIDTLVQQAVGMAKAEKAPLELLFPNTNVWMSELSAFLQTRPNSSLSLTSDIGGTYFLASGKPERYDIHHKRGRNGYSIPARMAMYTTQFLDSGMQLSLLPQAFQVEVLFLLYLVTEMASDQITLMDKNKLWVTLSHPDILAEVEDFVAASRRILNTLVTDFTHRTAGVEDSLTDALIKLMLQQTKELTPAGLYTARALSELLQSLTEAHGLQPGEEERIAKLDILKATPSTVLGAVALLTGYGERLSSSKAVSNLCNRLISDLAGADPKSPKTLPSLVLLNACMPIYEIGELPVAKNRLVFMMKQITTWFDIPEELDSWVAAESCKSLQRLLPCVKDVYGPYWERTIEFCIHLWGEAEKDGLQDGLSYIHASLKLISALEGISDPNDDLQDAITSLAQARSQALMKLLSPPRRMPMTQPEEIVDALLCRQIDKIPLTHIEDLTNLYGSVASGSRDIQTAAFTLLHKALPARQEQLSLDVLLDKKDAHLPDELLSLLLDAPTLEAYPEEELVQFPAAVRSYLLSWHLIFDAFSKASFKVRNDYTENLKTANSTGRLLEFTFDVLGHSAAHPLSLDKEGFSVDQITSYDVKLAGAEPDERSMQWLLVHLVYLALKYTPGLFKTWFIDCRSKQTKIAVEGWVTKYFSPIIISETLDEVAAWAASQEAPAEDEKELIIKVSKTAKEVTAGYEVDELTASIAIRVPPSYPLEGVTVVGNNRVAVNEKKWQSWLMTTQGVITFSNGSIIDGLTAFRRNVTGALKGQTECAICYSIISSDKRTPDKRCQTCRNLFHRTCLYKWFQSSNQNTCPLCRNPIDYLGSDSRGRRAAAA